MSSSSGASRALRSSKVAGLGDQRATKRRRANNGSGGSGGGAGTPPSSSSTDEEDLAIASMLEPEGWEAGSKRPTLTLLAAVAAAALAAVHPQEEGEEKEQEGGGSPPTNPSKPPTSKFKGVCWDKQHKRWKAQLWVDGKRCYLCNHESEEEAARAVDEFVRKHDLVDSKGLNLPTAAEQAQGNHTRKGKKRHNTSSCFTGVTFHKRTGKWQARLRTDSKTHQLGLFDSEEEAAATYDKAAAPLGRPLNLPDRE